MTPAEVEATACQTPLVDLLRRIPADAILRWDDSPYSSWSAPIGKYAREAADALFAQAAEIERMREALERLRDCDWITPTLDRMDAVRNLARQALTGKDG